MGRPPAASGRGDNAPELSSSLRDDLHLLVGSAGDEPCDERTPWDLLEAWWGQDRGRCIRLVVASAPWWRDFWQISDAVQCLVERHPEPELLDAVHRALKERKLRDKVRIEVLAALIRAGHQPAVAQYVQTMRRTLERLTCGGDHHAADLEELLRQINMFSLRQLAPDLQALKEARIDRGSWGQRIKWTDAAAVEATLVRFQEGRRGLLNRLGTWTGHQRDLPWWLFALSWEDDATDARRFADAFRNYRRDAQIQVTALAGFLRLGSASEIRSFLTSEVRALMPADPSQLRRRGCLSFFWAADPAWEIATLLEAAVAGPPADERLLAMARQLLEARDEWIAAKAWRLLKRHDPRLAPPPARLVRNIEAEELVGFQFDDAARRWRWAKDDHADAGGMAAQE
jgi:hypothetical protein